MGDAKRKPLRPERIPLKEKPPVHTTDKVIEAIRATRGKIHLAAKKLRISDKTIYALRKEHSEIDEAILEEKEVMLDVAEDMLRLAVEDREPWAIQFILKTQGRDRGYNEKLSIQHGGDPNNATPISFSHDDLDLPLEVKKQILSALRAKQSSEAPPLENEVKMLPAPKQPSLPNDGDESEVNHDSQEAAP